MRVKSGQSKGVLHPVSLLEESSDLFLLDTRTEETDDSHSRSRGPQKRQSYERRFTRIIGHSVKTGEGPSGVRSLSRCMSFYWDGERLSSSFCVF